jgi:hypothetical protein
MSGLRLARALTVGAALVLVLATGLSLAGCAARAKDVDRFRSGHCKPGNPLAGVYIPSRLHVVKRCVTVRGVVDCVRHEPDGDVHIELHVFGRFRRYLRPANRFQRCPQPGSGAQGPHLVVEIIPQNGGLPFPDNSAGVGGFVTPRAPAPGDRIVVTGPWVLDRNTLHDLIFAGNDVRNWAEIHPAWSVKVLH